MREHSSMPFSFLSAVLLFMTTLSAGAAWSQNSSDSAEMEEIQVTATRRPVETSAVSASLSIVGNDEFAAAKLLTDALAMQPGVFLQQTTPGQGAAIVRGLKGSEVLHLVDGMRLNNAIFRNAPTQYMALVAPGTLERVEIVRGAPASLYGSDAVGGVVQAISRIPSFTTSGIRRDATVAFDTADLARIVRASVDFGNDKLAALVSGAYLQSGNRRTGQGARVGPTGYESRGGRVALAVTPDDQQRWLFDLQFAEQPATPRFDELVPGFGETEPASSEFLFAPNQRIFGHIQHVRHDWLMNATWNFDFGWQRIVDDRVSRNFESSIRRYESNSSDLFGLTVNVAGENTMGSWVAGAEVYHDRVASDRTEQDLTNGQLDPIAARFPDGSTMDQAAIFGNVLRHVGNRSTISGGIRFSAISTDLAASAASAPTTSVQNDVSADLGWITDLTEHTQFTANVGYGFRAPNVFDLGTLGERPGNRFNIPNRDLVSERITQVDIGVRHQRETVDLDLVLFGLHYSDRIASVLTGAVSSDGRDITQSQNIEEADIYGVEFSAGWSLSPQAVAELVVNYLYGRQREAGAGAVPADRIPPLNGQLRFRYQLTDALLVAPYLFFAGSQDRLSPRDVSDSRIDPTGTPGWLTANIMASWEVNQSLSLTARFENILDQTYRVHGSGIDSVGRNLLVSMRVSW
ncbi:MAG: TonB-dependent receptor plug domain-containing protein [Woeseiaceae bacterium]